jgi:hypothetical protein
MAQEIKKAEARHEMLSSAYSIVYEDMRDGFFGTRTLARKEPARFFETELEPCEAVIEDEGDKSF